MSDDDMARLARAAGLARYLERYPKALKAALENAQGLAARLPRDIAPAEEPAHVYRIDNGIGPEGGAKTGGGR